MPAVVICLDGPFSPRDPNGLALHEFRDGDSLRVKKPGNGGGITGTVVRVDGQRVTIYSPETKCRFQARFDFFERVQPCLQEVACARHCFLVHLLSLGTVNLSTQYQRAKAHTRTPGSACSPAQSTAVLARSSLRKTLFSSALAIPTHSKLISQHQRAKAHARTPGSACSASHCALDTYVGSFSTTARSLGPAASARDTRHQVWVIRCRTVVRRQREVHLSLVVVHRPAPLGVQVEHCARAQQVRQAPKEVGKHGLHAACARCRHVRALTRGCLKIYRHITTLQQTLRVIQASLQR